MIQRFQKITNKLYRGSAPTPVDVISLKKDYGIKKIISLDKLSGLKIKNICEKLNIEHIIIPITFSKSSLINLLSYDFKKLFLEDGPVYVHCFHGKDRTGLVIALIKCKYFDVDSDTAIEEAKSFGFGIGVDSKIIKLYESLIKSCKSEDDINDSDIVSNQRYHDDYRSSVLEDAHRGSFAPYLDQTKTETVYRNTEDQSPTRENYKDYKKVNLKDIEEHDVPLVGIYNNDAGLFGAGPAFPAGGFITD